MSVTHNTHSTYCTRSASVELYGPMYIYYAWPYYGDEIGTYNRAYYALYSTYIYIGYINSVYQKEGNMGGVAACGWPI